MRYIAVYRREDDPDLAGLPVAMFRDGAMLGNWPKVTDGVYNRDFLATEVELPDDAILNADYAESAASPGVTTVDTAFAQLVAEKRAEITRETMTKAAEDQARRELQEDGVLAPNVVYPGVVESRPENAEPGTWVGGFVDDAEPRTAVAPLAETSGNVVVDSDDDSEAPAGPPDTTPAV